MSARLVCARQCFNKERFQLAENLQSARCSPFIISKVLTARMRKLITAHACKKKCTARMLAKTIGYPCPSGRRASPRTAFLTLLVLDDLMRETVNSDKVMDLISKEAHHLNLFMIVVT